LAGRLAAFHAASPAGPVSEAYGSTAAVSRNLEENFTQSRPFLPFLIGAEQAAELESRMRARFRLCAPALESRYLGHRIRDGHGDLRLCQIYVDGSGRSEILDCVEFNDRFRYGDPAGDVAFLSMDLAFHGHPEAAEGFLAAYAAASGDFGIYAVVDFYQAYRACVRGKVEGLRAAEMGPGPGRSLKEEEARAYFRFALVESLQPLPAIIAIGGGIGTGKTTLASRLGELLCAPVLSSDPLRKRMSGIGPLERRRDPLWQGLYAPENTRKVYAEAVRLAGLIGDSGRSVIVDASFRGRAERKAIRDAALEWGRPFLFVECRADPETCRARLRRRAAHPNASDGSEREFESFLDSWEPVQDIPSAERLVLDTAAPLPECVDRAMRACLWMRARTAHANLA
jgi:predicted kinase